MSSSHFFENNEMADISLNPKNGEIVLENASIYSVKFHRKTLKNITRIVLTNNELSEIEIPRMGKVNFIKLEKNHLREVKFGGPLPSLVSLDISTNGLQEINLPETPKLLRLNLSRNNIKSFGAQILNSLVVLDLSHNDLEEIVIPYLPSLEFVYLSGNNLRAIHIDPRNKLTLLNLSKNPSLGRLAKSWKKDNIPRVIEDLNYDYELSSLLEEEVQIDNLSNSEELEVPSEETPSMSDNDLEVFEEVSDETLDKSFSEDSTEEIVDRTGSPKLQNIFLF